MIIIIIKVIIINVIKIVIIIVIRKKNLFVIIQLYNCSCRKLAGLVKFFLNVEPCSGLRS